MDFKGNIIYYEQFAAVRNIKIAAIKEDKIYFLVPYPCPNLTDEGCRIYERRPDVCRMYHGKFDPALEKVCKLPVDEGRS
jgi:Fe-S-cluster containining protein